MNRPVVTHNILKTEHCVSPYKFVEFIECEILINLAVHWPKLVYQEKVNPLILRMHPMCPVCVCACVNWYGSLWAMWVMYREEEGGRTGKEKKKPLCPGGGHMLRGGAGQGSTLEDLGSSWTIRSPSGFRSLLFSLVMWDLKDLVLVRCSWGDAIHIQLCFSAMYNRLLSSNHQLNLQKHVFYEILKFFIFKQNDYINRGWIHLVFREQV